MSCMKKVAESYKGKHFVIVDEDMSDGFIDPYIDVERVIADNLEGHVSDCRYYGIPAYLGKDQSLHKRIGAINAELDKLESA